MLEGYRSLKGTSRRVETPSGDTISRRQYENIRAQRSGWRNWSQYQAYSASQDAAEFRFRIREQDAQRGLKPRRFSIDDSLIHDRYLLNQEGKMKRHPPGEFVENSPLGRILIAEGKKIEGERWGESA